MATTTNYGWTTPDDTDLVKDGAAAIRTLGSSVDTTTKALNPETTTGDIAYRSATANTNTRLALGTAGQVLTVNSGATAPEWATAASGSMTELASGTFSANALSLTSISGSYKNLVLVIRNAYMNDNLFVRVNNDSGSNYAWTQTPSTQAANNNSNSSNICQISYPNVTTGNGPNSATVTFHDYANANSHKLINSIYGGNAQGSRALSNNSHLWYDTAAINRIDSNVFASGSYILYGVK
jgi:hypothetical protein